MGTHPIFEFDFDCLTVIVIEMRRNSRILLFFGFVWFGGVMFYVRQAESSSESARINPKHPKVRKNAENVEPHEKRKKKHKKDDFIEKDIEKIGASLEEIDKELEHRIEEIAQKPKEN